MGKEDGLISFPGSKAMRPLIFKLSCSSELGRLVPGEPATLGARMHKGDGRLGYREGKCTNVPLQEDELMVAASC